MRSQWALILLMLLFSPTVSYAQGLSQSFSYDGSFDYVLIGNTESFEFDGQCRAKPSSSARLDLPGGAVVEKAILYWSGSSYFNYGETYIDDDVRLNSRKIVADRTWIQTIEYPDEPLHYYSAAADVTHLITRSRNMTISDLTWDRVVNCEEKSAYGGWVLLVVYSSKDLPQKSFNIIDGFEKVDPGNPLAFVWRNSFFPNCNSLSTITMVTWDADESDAEEVFIDDLSIGVNEIASNIGTQNVLDLGIQTLDIVNYKPTRNKTFLQVKGQDRFLNQLLIHTFPSCIDSCTIYPPADITIACDSSILPEQTGFPMSACAYDYTYSDTILEQNCIKTIRRTWKADAQDSIDYIPPVILQNIQLLDTTAPQIECDLKDDTLYVDKLQIVDQLSVWQVDRADELSNCLFDNCSNVAIELDFDVESVDIGCDGQHTLNVELWARDLCQNTSRSSFTLLLIDTTPQFLNCTIEVLTDFNGFGTSGQGKSDAAIELTVLDGKGPFDILWNTGDTMARLDSLIAGEYLVTVRDVEGCSCSSSIIVSEPQELVCEIDILKGISCAGESDAELVAIGRGGTMPYNYDWSTLDTLDRISELSAGMYDVTISDLYGNQCISRAVVTDPVPLRVSSETTLESCALQNGSINLKIEGGAEPYLISWNNGTSTSSIDSLSSGTYIAEITDGNGCSDTVQVRVEQEFCAGIGDFVWKDINANGMQDPDEPGVNDVKILLREALSELVVDSTVSAYDSIQNTDGYYNFDSIPSGIYQVVFVKDASFRFTVADEGDAIVDSDADTVSGVSFSFLVSPGELQNNIDAGLILSNSIGNRIWLDTDQNGLQGATEPGLAGVLVFLLDDLGEQIDSVVTDVSGNYWFTGLEQGSYKVEVILPNPDGQSGYQFTLQGDGQQVNLDSDIDPQTGLSDWIELGVCDRISEVDAGIFTKPLAYKINPNRIEYSIAAFPNPTKNELTIELSTHHTVSPIRKMFIYNTSGQRQLIDHYEWSIEDEKHLFKIDLQSLAIGHYTIRLVGESSHYVVPIEIVR